MNLGSNLKKKRSEQGITQAELAEKVGVAPAMINQIEHGVKTPSLATALALARELHTTVDALASSV